MNSPNKSATISVADFLFLPFFQTPLIPNSRYTAFMGYKPLIVKIINNTVVNDVLWVFPNFISHIKLL